MAKKKMTPMDERELQGARPVTIYPFYRHGNFAITVDVSQLTEDATQPTAKLNFVIDNKIVHTVSFQELVQTMFNI